MLAHFSFPLAKKNRSWLKTVPPHGGEYASPYTYSRPFELICSSSSVKLPELWLSKIKNNDKVAMEDSRLFIAS